MQGFLHFLFLKISEYLWTCQKFFIFFILFFLSEHFDTKMTMPASFLLIGDILVFLNLGMLIPRDFLPGLWKMRERLKVMKNYFKIWENFILTMTKNKNL